MYCDHRVVCLLGQWLCWGHVFGISFETAPCILIQGVLACLLACVQFMVDTLSFVVLGLDRSFSVPARPMSEPASLSRSRCLRVHVNRMICSSKFQRMRLPMSPSSPNVRMLAYGIHVLREQYCMITRYICSSRAVLHNHNFLHMLL